MLVIPNAWQVQWCLEEGLTLHNLSMYEQARTKQTELTDVNFAMRCR